MYSQAYRRTAVAALIAALSACATLRGRTEGPTVPIDLEIQNNLNLPSDLTIYAVSRSGARTLIGSVPPATTTSFRFKPVSFSEPYRLLANRALARPIRSQVFTVGSDMTGRIIWMLSPNIIGFEDVESDSTAADTSGAAPRTSSVSSPRP